MTRPTISGISPFFIVADVPAALSFYRDMLGFEVTFRGPTAEDEFFGIVRGEKPDRFGWLTQVPVVSKQPVGV